MHDNQSSYAFWSWVVALVLAIILFWMYLNGNGPTNACCSTDTTASSDLTVANDAPAITEAFSFTATATEFIGNGDASNITWISDIDALKALLSDNLKAEGDELTITLSGEVDSQEMKEQKLANAQAFFGPDAIINNQITVSMPMTTDTTPSTAKLYFESGVHALPADADSILGASIDWVNTHPEATVIISGYHDATGDLESNQQLAKKRAQSVYDALISAGIGAERIEMHKPESTQGDGDLSEARRVEVTIQ
ncbi:MAG: OmpA family protein [Methylotenera sp.]